MSTAALLGWVGLAAAAAGVSALAVRWFAHEKRTRGLAWAAAGLTLVAAVPAAGMTVPVATLLAGAGLAAAAVVDLAERRIPTPVAHTTTGVSAVALVSWSGFVQGEWGMVLSALLLTGAMVLVFAVIWLVGGMGFGDVRMAGGLLTAMTTGFSGLMVAFEVAFLTTGVYVIWRRLRHNKGGTVPFGPGLFVGWLVAIAV